MANKTGKTQNNGNKFIFTGKHVRLALTDSCDSILSSAPSDTESAHQNHPSEVPAHDSEDSAYRHEQVLRERGADAEPAAQEQSYRGLW